MDLLNEMVFNASYVKACVNPLDPRASKPGQTSIAYGVQTRPVGLNADWGGALFCIILN